jgi:DNA repair photolyase
LIFVKVNFADVLRRELDKPSWTREQVALGTATDPYQPIEGHYKLTRRSLEALIAGRTPVGIVTKGPMIVRDVDLLTELSRVAACTVYLSVPTVDEDAWRALEPGTAHPLQRLRAVRTLREAGVNAGVLMAPIVPGFTTQTSKLEATIKAVADHGAAFMGANVLHLKGGTKDHFMSFLAQAFPHMVQSYQRLYAGAYAPPAYADTVRALIDMLQGKHDVARRVQPVEVRHEELEETLPHETQQEFNW